MKIAIIVSQFNEMITAKMLEEAMRGLAEEGVIAEEMEFFNVPGAFEIPVAAQKLIDSKKYKGIIALGCVIRGETDHCEYICRGITYGIQKVSIENRFPVMFGILTVNNREQAMARVKKAYECAKGVLKMIEVFKNVK